MPPWPARRRLTAGLTPSPTPPDGLTPAQGGVLLAERVEPHHQIAWLLGAAADRHLAVYGSEQQPTVRRSRNAPTAPDPATKDVLHTMFAGRSELRLGGSYDPRFRAGWDKLAGHLKAWRADSGLWTEGSGKRVRAVRLAGLAVTVLGLVGAVAGALLGAGHDPAGDPVLTAGALATGVGAALACYGWELHSRTPRGTAHWLRTEAFRRYLADPSTVPDAEPLDDREVQRYTAWAVAFGMAGRWQRALEAATVPVRHPNSQAVRLGTAMAAGLFVASAASRRSPASSGSTSSGGSSSGGGFSDSVGGGAGGGGGGSW
ncbi:hypothetical protein [Streptomyces sp. NPDC046727]|uniref:DUF2207 family protein n=1 Tax=Streptomyces sp. NPDC046727 TaxID=3155373 RepID=UPI0033FC7426